MSSVIQTKKQILSALETIPDSNFLATTKDLLAVLGYRSERTLKLSGHPEDFIRHFPAPNENTSTEQAFHENAQSVRLIFQLTSDEIASSNQQSLNFEAASFDKGNTSSFIFSAVELKKDSYARGQYAQFTREINKRLSQPSVVLFRTPSNLLTLAFVHRRPHKRDNTRNVLESVTLIKDIRPDDPHRAHLDILEELSLSNLLTWMNDHNKPHNFDGLLAAWLAKLDIQELNRQFYQDLYNWFERAIEEATFPKNQTQTISSEEHVIRLITRLLFVWFIKEKKLIAEDLFIEHKVRGLLKNYDHETGDSYYRAVLQNLFFATLNTEIDKRRFSKQNRADHRNPSVYRYREEIDDPDSLIKLFEQTPFINGGLFDCLDSFEGVKAGGSRLDCFTDNPAQRHDYSIPNRLFFGTDGLITLFTNYKFTVEENTPIEQEVALDPELLGKVFENLLAAYNPETRETARKQTGSYYTPPPVVDYMVEEALVASLAKKCQPTDGDVEYWQERLRYLLDYEDAFDDAKDIFEKEEAEDVVQAIAEIKVLDPAVGSGAFPMGMLHKLTLALRRLDPDNERWEALQKERARAKADAAFETRNQQERDAELLEISEIFEQYAGDFGRKLYLIQNSIFGVDIQPIACQIAKLRFFISLAIEQEPDKNADNFGIKPLPNLETRFVVANTLLALTRLAQLTLAQTDTVNKLEQALIANRERYFHATTRQQKFVYKEKDKELRGELATELENLGFLTYAASKIANWDPYDQNASADWFDAEYMFGMTEGFDLVIGNPPYGAKIDRSDLKKMKAYARDTKNSNSAALFVDYARNRFIKTDGVFAFIVPKSLLYSQIWRDLASVLSEKTVVLVDVEKAFEKVKLEQVVFVYSAQCNTKHYIGRKFLDSVFTQTTLINRNAFNQFQAWICDVSKNEIELGAKIASAGIHLSNISHTTRGLPIQSLLTEQGDMQVIGGKEITRYGITGVKGYVNRENLNLANRKFQQLLQPKVLSQNIVAHIQNPQPHIKIISTVDKIGDVLNVDTVMNTVITNKDFSPVFISALFNSKLINWYAYKFIFCSAIRTMHFDNYYVGKIPIPRIAAAQQAPILQIADSILAIKKADPTADTAEEEAVIDKLVYELYGLTEEEIAVVEDKP